MVAAGRTNARALQRAVNNLDAHLGCGHPTWHHNLIIGPGWIGEPALAHLIEPLLPGAVAAVGSHAIAIAIAFFIITALHIILGELAPDESALQRSEGTALWVVRPLAVFLFLLHPVIIALNGLGISCLFGLGRGTGQGCTLQRS